MSISALLKVALVIILIVIGSAHGKPYTYKQSTDALKRVYGSGVIREPYLAYSHCYFNRSTWKTKADDCEFYYRKPIIKQVIHFDHVATSQRIAKWTGCTLGRAKCASEHKAFKKCYTDGHNLLPVLGVINLVRGTRPFGDISGSYYRPFGEVIDFRVATDGKMVTPHDRAKGRVARAMLYMESEDCVGLDDQEFSTFVQWNIDFPPTMDEIMVSELIHVYQGNRNELVSIGAVIK